jgi:G2/mitotic-specific cyclin 1/2
LRHYSGYGEDEVKIHADRLIEFLKRPLAYKSVFKKYSSKKLMKASVFVEAWIRRAYPDCPAAQSPPTVVD